MLGSAASSGTLDLGGFSPLVGGLSVAPGATASSQIVGNSSTSVSSTLTVNGFSTFGGTIQDTVGGGDQTTALAVAGGQLTLSGSNTFSGGTTVNGGTLQVGGIAAIPSGTGKGNVNVSAGGLFDLNGIGITVNGLTGAGVVTTTLSSQTPTTLTVGAANASSTFQGAILDSQGPIALTKVGSGIVVLVGTNGYSGLTTIDAGTLQLGSGSTGGIIAGSVLNNGVLAFNLSNATYGGTISGSGSLTTPGGSVVLTGSNSYTGPTLINAGTLQIGNGGTTGSIAAASVITANGTLSFDRADNVTYGGSILGAGAIAQNGSGNLVVTGVNSQFAGGSFDVNSGTLTVTANGELGNGTTATTLETAQTGGTIYLTGSSVVNLNRIAVRGTNSLLIDDNASVTTTGNFIVGVVSGNNIPTAVNCSATQNGGTVLVQGDFYDGGNFADGAGSAGSTGTYTQNGGTVTVVGTKLELAENSGTAAYQLNGGLLAVPEITLGNSGSFTFNGGTLAANTSAAPFMPAALVTAIQAGGAIIDTGTNSITLQPGLVEDPNSTGGGLTLYGGGTLILKGVNTYSGPTTISAGTLQIGKASTAGLNDASPVIDNGILAFDIEGNYTYAGSISGSGGLVQFGSGALILSGSDSYGGGTLVETGTLEVTSAAALPVGTSLVVGAGGIFDFDPTAAAAPLTGTASATPATSEIAAVPEPNAAALLLVALALWTLRRTEFIPFARSRINSALRSGVPLSVGRVCSRRGQ